MSARLVGYCTNVHAGATLDEVQRGLETHALAVKALASPDQPLGIGLWLAAPAAAQLARDRARLDAFAAWLAERGLAPFTFNGFPHRDFHGPRVKHRVYAPDWRDPARLRYTLDLVEVMAALLRAGARDEGGISTLPVAWGAAVRDEADARAAAAHLLAAADRLADLHEATGLLIHLDLEPEPGCYLQRSGDVVRFFDRCLLGRAGDARTRRHLRICHDVCHAAVMFDDQRRALERYAASGLLIGKVQVSSALRVRFDDLDEAARDAALTGLAAFAEDRYLHQTLIRRAHDDAPGAEEFHDDLHQALAAAAGRPRGEWRIHFHVPIYLDRAGPLETTRDHIDELLALPALAGVNHFEVETYAWGVLPPPLRRPTLAEGIAAELGWFAPRLAAWP